MADFFFQRPSPEGISGGGCFFICMIRKRKYLYVSYDIAKRALSDNRALDALAFTVSIKLNYQNSILYAKPIREAKQVFHIGQDKLRRVINDAETLKLIRRSNRNIAATRLRKVNAPNIRLYFGSCEGIKLNTIKDCIRKQILLNYFSVTSKFRNTEKELLKSKDDKAYVKTKAYNKAKRFAQKCMNQKELDRIENSKEYILQNNRGVSKRSIAKRVNCSIGTAHRLVREMRNDGTISVVPNIVYMCDLDDKAFDERRFNAQNNTESSYCHFRRLAGHGGLFAQFSNSYLPNKKSIFFCVK